MMVKRVFIWVGHPKAGSLCEGLADAYQAAAERSGCELRRMNLSAMSFDIAGFTGYGGGHNNAMPPLELDLEAWQESVAWADHLLFVHPYWWGAMPAKAKAVLDRALAPGFGFQYRGKGLDWDKLLTGKTADVIITSDTPPLIDRLIYRKPGRRVIKNQVLEFCGVEAKQLVQFGPVKAASRKKIGKWLQRAKQMGAKAAG
jgi:NAD(P)H dehydrogenase (quinone)